MVAERVLSMYASEIRMQANSAGAGSEQGHERTAPSCGERGLMHLPRMVDALYGSYHTFHAQYFAFSGITRRMPHRAWGTIYK